MPEVKQFIVKAVIDRNTSSNKKKITDAIKKAIENLRSKEIHLVSVEDSK